MQETVNYQISQKSDQITFFNHDQLTQLKNQTDAQVRAVALDITQRVTATESKFTQKLRELNRRTQIATRSASSKWDINHGVMHGELYYTGLVAQAWVSSPQGQDQNQWYQFTFKDLVSVDKILTRGRGDLP